MGRGSLVYQVAVVLSLAARLQAVRMEDAGAFPASPLHEVPRDALLAHGRGCAPTALPT